MLASRVQRQIALPLVNLLDTMRAAERGDYTQRAKVTSDDEIGELMRGHLELSADAVPQKKFDALWREIDKGIERATKPPPAPPQEFDGTARFE